jgi:hypothetical protein
MLKLPKSFSFPQPKIKPTGLVEIDCGNPIARGLTRLIAVDDLYDPANKSQLITYGTQQKIMDLDGSGRSFAGGSGLLCGNRSPHNGSFTVLAVAKPASFTGNGNIVGCHSDLSGLANFQFRITAGAKLEFIPFVANAAKTLTGATTLTANKSYALAATYDASLTVATAKVFVNGVQDAALNVTGAMDTDAAALAIGTRFRLANGTNPADFFTGNIYFVLMFDRSLSASEIRSLSDNPYQILKLVNDLYYFPVQSGGGGPSTQTLLVSSIVTGEAFGQPSISFNAIALSVSAIASGEAFGQVTIDTTRQLFPSGIPSLEAFGLCSVSAGSVTISTLGIASGEAVGVVSIAAGTYVRPDGITSVEALGQPEVQALSVDISPVGIGSLEAFGLPSVPREAVTISATGVSSSALIGEPMILVGDVTVSVTSANNGEVMGQPEVRLAQLFIRPEGIYSGMTFGRVVIVGGDFTYVSSDYAIVSPVVTGVVQSVVTAIAA